MRLRRRADPTTSATRPAEPYLLAGAVEARRFGHASVGTEHVLLAMLRNEDGETARLLHELGVSPASVEAALGLQPAGGARIDAAALASLGIDLEAVRAQVEASFGPGALELTGTGCLGVQPQLKQSLARAVEEAGSKPLADAEMLRGMLSVPDSYAACALTQLGVTLQLVPGGGGRA